MNLREHIAKHLREVHAGGNWTTVNIKEVLSGLSWQQVNIKIHSLNSIAALAFHINYYVAEVAKVLAGAPLAAHDKFSFSHPPVKSQEDWDRFVNKILSDAEILEGLINQLPESKLWEDFTDKKYGIYYRNLHGIIEHIHYHLGQIVIIKKIVLEADATK